MNEAYFEQKPNQPGAEKYPFYCKLSCTNGQYYSFPFHWHYYLEVYFVVDGLAEIYIGGNKYQLGRGDLAIIGSRDIHATKIQEGQKTTYITIQFEPEVLYPTGRTVFEAKYILPLMTSQIKLQRVFSSTGLSQTNIPKLIEDVYHEYRDKKYAFEFAIRTGICNLYLWLLRCWEQEGLNADINSAVHDIDIEMFQNLIEYIDTHYTEKILAEDMSKKFNISYSYFSRHFKKVMGKSFTEYLNFVRIAEAERLLMTTGKNINEVAISTGFNSASYFIKQFKRLKGICPKKFRIESLGK